MKLRDEGTVGPVIFKIFGGNRVENNKKSHVKVFYYGIAVLSCVMYILIIYATVQISMRYAYMVNATDNHISCEQDAQMVSDGSDILTETVRLYAVTTDKQYAEDYFTELNVTKRREKALQQLENHNVSEEARDFLQTALDNSNALTKREFYSMRLVSEAMEYDMESLPQEIGETELTAEDMALGREEMLEKGRLMVFDDGYKVEKDAVMDNISHFLDSVISETRK